MTDVFISFIHKKNDVARACPEIACGLGAAKALRAQTDGIVSFAIASPDKLRYYFASPQGWKSRQSFVVKRTAGSIFDNKQTAIGKWQTAISQPWNLRPSAEPWVHWVTLGEIGST